MFLIMFITLLSLLISLLLILISSLISKKKNYDREKLSPFECGFDPKSQSRIPFSIQFFMITIIFLIFDVEIAIILPIIITANINNKMFWFLTFTFFLIILILGIFYEWKMNFLNWKF
uniref:NADH dehydrogenase subunit 3 n=1 Tax=Cheumatopsyche charites TaxID=1875285 RepID=UPI0022DCDA80|nr:NADH dehydrogenase subunit 3 [Cheumatopsyche charites]UZZ43837.1 NADH dehydrogenase subunit 3 [Cheumatopsyche charites]